MSTPQARITEILSANGWYYQNDSPLSVWNMAKGLDGEMVPVPELKDEENEHLKSMLGRLNTVGEVQYSVFLLLHVIAICI